MATERLRLHRMTEKGTQSETLLALQHERLEAPNRTTRSCVQPEVRTTVKPDQLDTRIARILIFINCGSLFWDLISSFMKKREFKDFLFPQVIEAALHAQGACAMVHGSVCESGGRSGCAWECPIPSRGASKKVHGFNGSVQERLGASRGQSGGDSRNVQGPPKTHQKIMIMIQLLCYCL